MPPTERSLTCVIWDVVDFALPTDYCLSTLGRKIQLAFNKCGYLPRVSIRAFGDKLEHGIISHYATYNIVYRIVDTNKRRDTSMLMAMINLVYCQKLHRCFDDIHILLVLKHIPPSLGPVFDKLKSSFHGRLHIHLVQDISELNPPISNLGTAIGNLLTHVLFDHVELVWAWEALTSGDPPMVQAPFIPQNWVVPKARPRSVTCARFKHRSANVVMKSIWEGSLCVAFKVLKKPIASSEDAEINIFWNVDDFPIPPRQDLHSFLLMIKSALESEGFHGALSIKAYGSEDNRVGQIPFVCHEDSYSRLHHMLSDIRLSTVVNFNPYSTAKNLMVLAKNIPKGIEFVNLLDAMTDMHYNVLLAVYRNCWEAKVPQVKKIWLWGSLIRGGKAIESTSTERRAQ